MNKKRMKKGQTFIEVLVALTVLMTVMMAAFIILFTTLRFAISTREETQAVAKIMQIANERISEANRSYSPTTNYDTLFYLAPGTVYYDGALVLVESTLHDITDSNEPGYGMFDESGNAVFKKYIVSVRVARSGEIFTESRLVKVK